MRRGGSNFGVHVSNSNDSDELDPDYALFLNSLMIVDGNEDYMHVKNTTNTSQGVFHSRKMRRGGSNIGVNVTNSNDSDELDPDYALFLNSVTILDGNDDYMHVKNATNTSQVEENTSNSSDSDLIIDDNEDYDDSQFRTRLMERLDKPYDYEEYKNLISKLCDTNQKERHFKKRLRVVESYHSKGFTTPYCETYPDIAKAIAKVSTEKPRVLFLLRGFFFWLENVSHMGSFQPWHDELCLELLRKM